VGILVMAKGVGRQNDLETIIKLHWDISPDMVLVFSGEDILFCSAAGAAILEAESVEEVLSRKFIRLVDPEYRANYTNISSGYSQPLLDDGFKEEIFVTLKFHRIWLETRKIIIQFNGKPACLVYGRKIQKWKEVEESHQMQSEEIKAMLLDKLTKTEKRILNLYGQGKNRVAISRELDIEEGTVDRHTTNIKRKLKKKKGKDLLNFAMDLQKTE